MYILRPQAKMPVKFQKHLLKAVGGVVLTRYLYYMHFNSIEPWMKKVYVKS